jgi:transposase
MESKFADISDELWDRVQWLLPTPPVRRNHKGGRPPTPDRVALSGILYRRRTGCQWEASP